jgi:hypothetical protein
MFWSTRMPRSYPAIPMFVKDDRYRSPRMQQLHLQESALNCGALALQTQTSASIRTPQGRTHE